MIQRMERKKKRVVVTIEAETNIPIAKLRKKESWQIEANEGYFLRPIQIQANMIKKE